MNFKKGDKAFVGGIIFRGRFFKPREVEIIDRVDESWGKFYGTCKYIENNDLTIFYSQYTFHSYKEALKATLEFEKDKFKTLEDEYLKTKSILEDLRKIVES